MKKILAMLLALPLLLLAACHDDKGNDLPNVDVTVDISGGTVLNGQIYVVADTVLSVDSIGITNLEAGKAAAITGANYYFDYQFIGQNLQSPFGLNMIIPAGTKPGSHLLRITAPLLAVDKAPAYLDMQYVVTIVPSAADIPGTGTTTLTGNFFKVTQTQLSR